jgi:hypothetical protein
MKRKNPYTKLLEIGRRFASALQCRKITNLFYFNAKDLKERKGFVLDGLYERVIAAEQLNHDVLIRANDKGMSIEYRERVKIPNELL